MRPREQRADVVRLNANLQAEFAAEDMTFNQPEAAPFRERLHTAGFYSEWKGKYGDQARHCWKSPRQTVVTRRRGTVMVMPKCAKHGRRGEWPPRRRSLARHRMKLWRAGRDPAALLVVAEIVILFARRGGPLRLHEPYWSDELASILFLWLAMLGAAVAFRRSEQCG